MKEKKDLKKPSHLIFMGRIRCEVCVQWTCVVIHQSLMKILQSHRLFSSEKHLSLWAEM